MKYFSSQWNFLRVKITLKVSVACICDLHTFHEYTLVVYCRPKEKMIDCVHKQRDTIRYILFLKFDYDHRRNAEISLKCKNL